MLTWASQVLFRLLLLLAMLTACASMTWPFGWDQGIFAWIGDVINRGGLPYRDGWDIKGPLVYYLYALAQWLFGQHTWSIRVLDLVLLSATCFAMYRLLHAYVERAVANWSVLLFALWYAAGSYWHTAQPDGWVAMLLTIALAVLVPIHRWRPWFPYLVAGVLIGCTVQVKVFYAAFLLLPASIALAEDLERAEILRRAFACAVGFVAPVILVVAWFAAQGALGDMREVALQYPADTYTELVQFGFESRVRGLLEFITGGPGVAVALPFAMFGLIVSWNRSRPLALALVSWGAVATIAVIVQNRFFTYHWLPLYPVIVVSTAIGVSALLQSLAEQAQQTRTVFAGSLLVAMVLHIVPAPAWEVLQWASWLAGRKTDAEYHNHFGSPGDDIKVAQQLRDTTDPDDEVVVFGWNTAVLFMSGRSSPTRFGFSMPLMQGGSDSIWRDRYRAEFMRAIEVKRPAAFVVAPQAERLLGGDYSLADFPELADHVARYYDRGKQTGDVTMYLRQSVDDSDHSLKP